MRKIHMSHIHCLPLMNKYLVTRWFGTFLFEDDQLVDKRLFPKYPMGYGYRHHNDRSTPDRSASLPIMPYTAYINIAQ